MDIAEIIDTITPIKKVRANPLIKEVPNQNKIKEVIMLEIFESLTESQALLNPWEIDSETPSLFASSSFILSKIKTFASTAIPSEIINPAIPAAVNVTGINLNKDNTITIYKDKATTANNPGSLYQKIKKIAIANNPTKAALTPAVVASPPRDGPMV